MVEHVDAAALSDQNIHNAIADFVIEIENAKRVSTCVDIAKRLDDFRATFEALYDSCWKKARTL